MSSQPKANPWVLERITHVSKILQDEKSSDEDLAVAAQLCETLLMIDRDNPGVVFLLATVYMRAGKYGIAENLLYRTIQLKHKSPEAWNNLGFICQSEGRWAGADKAFTTAIAQAPGNLEAQSNLASLYVNNGTPAKALRMCDAVLKEAPTMVDALWNRALALLELGKWQEGWEAYRTGLAMSDRSSVSRKVRYRELPYWDGNIIPGGKNLVVYGEQGVGDEIMGFSMINDAIKLTGGRMVLETHPRLMNIAREAFPDIHVYGTRKAPEGSWQANENLGAQIPLLGLGEYFRSSDAAFLAGAKPYLDPDHEGVARAREKYAEPGKPLIGISWAGGSMTTRADVRSLPMKWLHENLLAEFANDVTWMSLQYDPPEQPGFYTRVTDGYRRDTGVNLIHDVDAINDLDVCYLSVAPACDLIISVCTSLVHACGATGTNVMVLTPREVAWRYGQQGPRMPWYGEHVTLARQARAGYWDEPMAQVRKAVKQLVDGAKGDE